MNWTSLLSLNRYGDTADRPRASQDDLRLGFEVDYDRIIFSHAFRSLQDKTQVIPLSQTGFVHTRLTHSLEVSSVARSLGRLAGHTILQRYPELTEQGYQMQDFGAITAAAALAHDIGNPPYGHSGEKAIGSFFEKYLAGEDTTGAARGGYSLSRKRKNDLTTFEGNANGYYLLNKDTASAKGGIRLSYAVLGAFVKYPKQSLPHRPTRHVADKKYNIFQADVDHFSQVADQLGLTRTEHGYHRHPLAYLVEAADDICYTVIDFEDGVNLGWIPEDYALEYFSAITRDSIITEKYLQMDTTRERMGYLRSLAINSLIQDAVSIFLDHEEEILNGSFSVSLMDKSRYKAQIEDILNITIQKVYRHQEVIQKEISGYRIIERILDAAVNAATHHHQGNCSHYDGLLLGHLPHLLIKKEMTDYEVLLETASHIASLTDHQSVKLAALLEGRGV